MRVSFRGIAVIGLLPFLVTAQSPELSDYFSSANRCDYLIMTPQQFADGAGRLAQYRNEFPGDDVAAARYVTVESLAAQFPRGIPPPDSMLRESISWAFTNWALAPSYIVFIGDDSVKYIAGDSLPGHGGPMPTHIKWERSERYIGDSLAKIDTTVEYSDNWYLMARDTASGQDRFISRPPPAFGRIPCERPEELNGYIDKVKSYDALGGAPWRNRVLFLTDNNLEKDQWDMIDHTPCAISVMRTMRGRFEEPLFLARYPVGATFLYPAEAKTVFFSSINNGCGWVVYFGHGHPTQLTSEKFLAVSDNQLFANSQKPVIMFSMSCRNGAFYKAVDSAMCKAWLFTENGGAIVYVASPTMEYADMNTYVMKRLSVLDDSLPGTSVGKLLAYEKVSDWNVSGPGAGYEVLGDPAIRASLRRMPLTLRTTAEETVQCVPDNGYNNGDSLYWECSRTVVWRDSLRNTDVPFDTVLFSGTERLTDGTFTITQPDVPAGDTLKLVVYAWNSSGAESRGEISICNGCVTGVAPDQRMIAGKTASTAPFRASVQSSRHILFTFDPRHGVSNISLFRIDGRLVATVSVPAGSSRFLWNRTKLPSGTYIAHLRSVRSGMSTTRFIVP